MKQPPFGEPVNESATPPAARSASAPSHHRHARAAIVNTAAATMYHHGIAATSTGDVARASGAEPKELHRHFRDKTELVQAVIDRELAVVLDGQDTTEAITSWEGLDRWVSRVVDAQPAEDRPFACPLGTLATDLKHSQEYRPALAAAFRIWEGHLAAGLRRIQQRGELDSDANPDRLAASLVAALQGGFLLASVHGRIEIMRDVLDDAVAALRRYQV
ncbi:TetR/AcrR family transcriptional regulator [Mycobacteroides abscessus]|uniref:TetR/AcrR family transcriptional regulator n=1 Tax=Mycobacteroides abscessus TaxID=36809 RepID=UPI0009A65737|nr:TetR/AcrR family transcriptional regulator [Mycobacteroides abscessus]SLJ80855.1 Putative transcriptional regulator, TetR family [Mycobacteroides abscessus subsp. abscessus]SLJ80857.1 Putative transcriptional regulator, TetR family [Mycobacteroides abscessus subsp. abscessus]